MTGVVGHPVSEKGNSGSPSIRINGNTFNRPNSPAPRKRDLDGERERFADSHPRESPLQRMRGGTAISVLQAGWYRGGIPSSLMWMKEFCFNSLSEEKTI
jgi:hypothetical protein